ncbi:hypothetical protein R0137_11050 [Congregibacter brevis]|uniref:Uncharacterized protein n=1 Tax=Congregibacter brevis TaxID=3081201 RepID=A0ABZ0IB44_9GAMM|nr:hypothetical protein R0137_11050 [Congregibacter sp. IMCC45268]
MKRRYERWQHDYRQRRYMKNLTDEAVKDRTRHVFNNASEVTAEGRVSLRNPSVDDGFWLRRWTEVLEELRIRNIGIDTVGVRRSGFPSPNNHYVASAVETFGSDWRMPEGSILKLGSREFLRPAFTDGIFRVAPASTYRDPSLNAAILDNELDFAYQMFGDEVEITLPNGRKTKPIGDVEWRVQGLTNYYVQCFAGAYSPRLFADFKYDSAILIEDTDAFFSLLSSAVDRKLGEQGFTYLVTPVEYVDPLANVEKDLLIPVIKHFKYAYQSEIRALWVPDSPTMELEALTVELGDMSEYAKYFSLAEDLK